jgi:hypothetical protein
MPEQEAFDLDSFRSKVLDEIKTLRLMVSIRETRMEAQSKLDSLRVRDLKSLLAFVQRKVETLSPLEGLKTQKRVDELSARAKSFLESGEARAALCPSLRAVEGNLSRLALRSVETDAAEIAAAITPLLASAARGERASLSLDPTLFAICAWMIARTGVSDYCSLGDTAGGGAAS